VAEASKDLIASGSNASWPLLCDVTTEASGQDPGGLARIAEKTKAMIVTGTLPPSTTLAQGSEPAKHDLIYKLQYGLPVTPGGSGGGGGGTEDSRAGVGFIGPVEVSALLALSGQGTILLEVIAGAHKETGGPPIFVLSQHIWGNPFTPDFTTIEAALGALVAAGVPSTSIVLGRLPPALIYNQNYIKLLQQVSRPSDYYLVSPHAQRRFMSIDNHPLLLVDSSSLFPGICAWSDICRGNINTTAFPHPPQ